ncbi:hypothetical protein KVR01_004738 [Diaporthe batatas]|uniref:uncharacterized protein n=1 Tax=Diaporthe batatas TaxID=748121 RepID=UPI001D052866|nr:uncharacterized protein KVR01_004738 [Diaporthe batatas]KAG8166186.1 hypothetical protein KVR01_004738 [Diaporthe batatas]
MTSEPLEAVAHPVPFQVMEYAVIYAELLRALYGHPQFKYLEPPTAAVCKIDESTPPPLFFATDFVAKTYINYIIPFLPPGATRKCKIIANPWAYADPDYQWEWEWDAASGTMKSADGATVEFPRIPQEKVPEMLGDLVSRGYMAKSILENGSDPRVTAMIGGPFDFGEEVKRASEKVEAL